MLMSPWLSLLLPVAACSGWWMGYKDKRKRKRRGSRPWSKDYFVGLNYLLNEEPDKAVDIFIKMLEVDSDTVETHLALGSLFRRRGEVDRAIRIHQNLIARPQLSKEQRLGALAELGQDYMRAGVLDRAERLFHEVIEADPREAVSLRYLLDIYEQEKDWHKAIETARKVELAGSEMMHPVIAQYYCELANLMREQNQPEQMMIYLKRAQLIHKNCVRASLMQGEIAMQNQQYKQAIRWYKRAIQQEPDFISEAINPLTRCHQELGEVGELINFLEKCLQQHPRISIVLKLAELLREQQGDKAATDYVANYLRQHPSIRGLKRVIELQLSYADKSSMRDLAMLDDITKILLKDKPNYRCNHCGFSTKSLYWQCPGCKHWASVRPIHGVEGE